ncbi:MAG: tetratricopeptide repeat protein [bacterium]|nr:tetratricopeptide repeat protein [bacterium]
MDRLDILSISLIVLLTALITGMVALHGEEQEQTAQGAPLGSGAARSAKAARSAEQNIYGEVERLIKLGQYEEAGQALSKIMDQYPQRLESQVYLAVIYERQGNIEKAISLCRSSIEKNPDLVDLASANLSEMIQKDIPKLKREKELKPNDERVSNMLRDLYFCQRKFGQGCE